MATQQRRKVVPSWLVRLRLRLEDSVASVPVTVLPPGWQAAGETSSQSEPGAFSEIAQSPYAAIGIVNPTSVRLRRTPHRQPDEVSIRFPWDGLPVDPRAIRAIGVEVFAKAVAPSELERAARDGSAAFDLTPETRRFVGFVKPSSWEPRGEIELQASDFTKLLIDARLSPSMADAVDLRKPLDRVFKTLVDGHPATRGMPVVWIGDPEAPSPVEAGAVPSRTQRVRVKTKRREGAEEIEFPASEVTASAPAAEKEGAQPTYRIKEQTRRVPYIPMESDPSLWDVITDISTRAACVAWVRGSTLYVGPARTVFGGSSLRRFVDGRNLHSLRFSRDLGRRYLPAVEVRCWSPDLQETLLARYPVDSSPSEDDEIRIVAGIDDTKRLQEVAEAIYHEIKREPLGGEFETIDLSPLGQDDGSLLGMYPGEALEVGPPLSAFQQGDLSGMPAHLVRYHLERAGVDTEVAGVMAEAMSRGASTTFWLSQVEISHSTRAGRPGTTIRPGFSELPVVTQQTTQRGPSSLTVRQW